MTAWFGALTKTSFGTQSIISSTRTICSRALFSTGQASILAMTWVWFLNLDLLTYDMTPGFKPFTILNLDSGEAVETKL